MSEKDDARPEVGTIMPDGTIMAGISPTTNTPMYVAANDVRQDFFIMEQDVVHYAEHGHTDWRIPTYEELEVIYNNREVGALRATFNLASEFRPDAYQSCSSADPRRCREAPVEIRYARGSWTDAVGGGPVDCDSEYYHPKMPDFAKEAILFSTGKHVAVGRYDYTRFRLVRG